MLDQEDGKVSDEVLISPTFHSAEPGEGRPNRFGVDRGNGKVLLQPVRYGKATHTKMEGSVKAVSKVRASAPRERNVNEPARDPSRLLEKVLPPLRGKVFERVLAEDQVERFGRKRKEFTGRSDGKKIRVWRLRKGQVATDQFPVPKTSQTDGSTPDLQNGKSRVILQETEDRVVPWPPIQHTVKPIMSSPGPANHRRRSDPP